MKKISAKEANRIAKKLNLQLDGDGVTFYATNNSESEIYEFETKQEREQFLRNNINNN